MTQTINAAYGIHSHRKFTDLYSDADSFIADYNDVGIPTTISEVNARTLYYLLYARYGNSIISSFDETQFKYQVFSTIYRYGPTWQKRLQIQEQLRTMTDDEIREGTMQINNNALHPGQAPGTDAFEAIKGIDSQSATKYKKDRLTAYANMMSLLERDVTGEFIDKFKYLFRIITQPDGSSLFVSTVVTPDDDNTLIL